LHCRVRGLEFQRRGRRRRRRRRRRIVIVCPKDLPYSNTKHLHQKKHTKITSRQNSHKNQSFVFNNNNNNNTE
jgi:hypothetical protein